MNCGWKVPLIEWVSSQKENSLLFAHFIFERPLSGLGWAISSLEWALAEQAWALQNLPSVYLHWMLTINKNGSLAFWTRIDYFAKYSLDERKGSEFEAQILVRGGRGQPTPFFRPWNLLGSVSILGVLDWSLGGGKLLPLPPPPRVTFMLLLTAQSKNQVLRAILRTFGTRGKYYIYHKSSIPIDGLEARAPWPWIMWLPVVVVHWGSQRFSSISYPLSDLRLKLKSSSYFAGK